MRAITGTVSGRVQGVGFRWSARREAVLIGVAGWVRNLPDGRVEVFAQGPNDAVARFEAWLRSGPVGARVVDVSLHDAPPETAMEGFAIR